MTAKPYIERFLIWESERTLWGLDNRREGEQKREPAYVRGDDRLLAELSTGSYLVSVQLRRFHRATRHIE